MRSSRSRRVLLASFVGLLAGAMAFVCLRYVAQKGDSHARNAGHPHEVARILELLPDIPATASHEEIIALLDLPAKWTGGSVSSTHCAMTWEITPTYRFVLSFNPTVQNGKLPLVFAEAAFSASGKPGFPPHEYHTVYPYRTWKGMVTE